MKKPSPEPTPTPAPSAIELLSAPFAESELKERTGRTVNGKTLVLPYVDAVTVMDRLDSALGMDGWSDEYSLISPGVIQCRLSCRMESGHWVTKSGVGASDMAGSHADAAKAAASDALKRAAVKFGVGRYLYSLPEKWKDPSKPDGKPAGKPPEPAKETPSLDIEKELRRAAAEGTAALRRAWGALTNLQRQELQGKIGPQGWNDIKDEARKHDATN